MMYVCMYVRILTSAPAGPGGPVEKCVKIFQ